MADIQNARCINDQNYISTLAVTRTLRTRTQILHIHTLVEMTHDILYGAKKEFTAMHVIFFRLV